MAGITELKKDLGLLLDIANAVEHYLASSKTIIDVIRDFYPLLGAIGSANLDLQMLKDEALDLDSVEQEDLLKFVASKGAAGDDFWKKVQLGIGVATDLLVAQDKIKERIINFGQVK